MRRLSWLSQEFLAMRLMGTADASSVSRVRPPRVGSPVAPGCRPRPWPDAIEPTA